MELKKWEIGKFKNQDLTPSTPRNILINSQNEPE